MAACAMLVLGSCRQGAESLPIATPATVQLNVHASRSDAADAVPQSRAVLDSGASRWEIGDQIAVYADSYAASSASQATLRVQTLTDDGQGAYFAGEAARPTPTDTFYAAYPASVAVDSDEAVFTIPASQTSTARPQLMMIARSADNTPSEDIYLTFEPANAFLHITLDEAVTGLTAVMVEGCEGEVLTGDYPCRFDDGTTRMSASGTTRITVANPSGDFYVALPAVTLNKGYRLTFYRGSERMIKTYGYDTGKTLTKGGVYGVNIGSFTPVSADLSGVYTNYDIYRLQGAAAANALDGMTIFADNIIVRGVPSKLIDEVSLRIDGEQVPVVFDSAGADGVVYKVVDGIKTFVKNARADYAVAATITVDGQNCEYTRTVSVTGLPYDMNFYANSNDDYVVTQQGWSLYDHAWQAGAAGSKGGLGLTSLNSYGISPAFNIPDDTNISAHGQYYLYSANFFRPPTSYFRADVTDSPTVPGQTSTPVSIKASAMYPAQASRSDFSWNLTFTHEKNRLSLSRATNADGRIMIYNVYVNYR